MSYQPPDRSSRALERVRCWFTEGAESPYGLIVFFASLVAMTLATTWWAVWFIALAVAIGSVHYVTRFVAFSERRRVERRADMIALAANLVVVEISVMATREDAGLVYWIAFSAAIPETVGSGATRAEAIFEWERLIREPHDREGADG